METRRQKRLRLAFLDSLSPKNLLDIGEQNLSSVISFLPAAESVAISVKTSRGLGRAAKRKESHHGVPLLWKPDHTMGGSEWIFKYASCFTKCSGLDLGNGATVNKKINSLIRRPRWSSTSSEDPADPQGIMNLQKLNQHAFKIETSHHLKVDGPLIEALTGLSWVTEIDFDGFCSSRSSSSLNRLPLSTFDAMRDHFPHLRTLTFDAKTGGNLGLGEFTSGARIRRLCSLGRRLQVLKLFCSDGLIGASVINSGSLSTICNSMAGLTGLTLWHVGPSSQFAEDFYAEDSMDYAPLSRLRNLGWLILNNCTGVDDEALEHISKCRALEQVRIWLWDHDVTDEGVAHLATLPFLNQLILTSHREDMVNLDIYDPSDNPWQVSDKGLEALVHQQRTFGWLQEVEIDIVEERDADLGVDDISSIPATTTSDQHKHHELWHHYKNSHELQQRLGNDLELHVHTNRSVYTEGAATNRLGRYRAYFAV